MTSTVSSHDPHGEENVAILFALSRLIYSHRGNDAGIIGAAFLAQQAYEQSNIKKNGVPAPVNVADPSLERTTKTIRKIWTRDAVSFYVTLSVTVAVASVLLLLGRRSK